MLALGCSGLIQEVLKNDFPVKVVLQHMGRKSKVLIVSNQQSGHASSFATTDYCLPLEPAQDFVSSFVLEFAAVMISLAEAAREPRPTSHMEKGYFIIGHAPSFLCRPKDYCGLPTAG